MDSSADSDSDSEPPPKFQSVWNTAFQASIFHLRTDMVRLILLHSCDNLIDQNTIGSPQRLQEETPI